MPDFKPADPDFEARVRESFARQGLMGNIGARLARVAPGEVDIEVASRSDLTQQHGYMHAGVVTAATDTACGYAAMTLTPPGGEVLSIEFKINLLSPAVGDLLAARARVVRAGRNVTVCAGDAFMVLEGREKLVATMLATMMVRVF